MYRIGDVSRVTQLTPRQVRHWHKTGLMPASVDGDGRGPGHYMAWSFSDLVVLRMLKRLLDQNISVQKIGNVMSYLREKFPGRELSDTRLMVVGTDVICLPPNADLPFSVLEQRGQVVLKIDPDDVAEEVKQRVEDLGLQIAN